MPETTAEPPQAAVNFTGIVLLNLKVRTGLAKLPPVASAPPIGARKPVKSNGARVTLNVQLEQLPLESVAVQFTGVVPTGNPEPGGME